MKKTTYQHHVMISTLGGKIHIMVRACNYYKKGRSFFTPLWNFEVVSPAIANDELSKRPAGAYCILRLGWLWIWIAVAGGVSSVVFVFPALA